MGNPGIRAAPTNGDTFKKRVQALSDTISNGCKGSGRREDIRKVTTPETFASAYAETVSSGRSSTMIVLEDDLFPSEASDRRLFEKLLRELKTSFGPAQVTDIYELRNAMKALPPQELESIQAEMRTAIQTSTGSPIVIRNRTMRNSIYCAILDIGAVPGCRLAIMGEGLTKANMRVSLAFLVDHEVSS